MVETYDCLKPVQWDSTPSIFVEPLFIKLKATMSLCQEKTEHFTTGLMVFFISPKGHLSQILVPFLQNVFKTFLSTLCE